MEAWDETKDDWIGSAQVLRDYQFEKEAATRLTRLVLVKREDEHYPFVVALHCVDDREWIDGHYFGTFNEAERDFATRLLRRFAPELLKEK